MRNKHVWISRSVASRVALSCASVAQNCLRLDRRQQQQKYRKHPAGEQTFIHKNTPKRTRQWRAQHKPSARKKDREQWVLCEYPCVCCVRAIVYTRIFDWPTKQPSHKPLRHARAALSTNKGDSGRGAATLTHFSCSIFMCFKTNHARKHIKHRPLRWNADCAVFVVWRCIRLYSSSSYICCLCSSSGFRCLCANREKSIHIPSRLLGIVGK